MDKSSELNQRKYVRVNIDIDMHLVLVDAKAVGLLEGKERIRLRQGKIHDLSAAGMKVKVEDIDQARQFHLLSGAIVVALKFTLPGQTTSIGATASVMRIVPDRDAEIGKCTLGLKFTEITAQDRTMLTAFVESQKSSR